MKGVVSILAVVAATGLLAAGSAGASGINGINNGMPNRISMNVTVPKQTQGASFGEKVSSGLQAAGSAVAQGASLSLVVECGQAACAIAFPDGDGYRADTTRMTLQPLSQAQAQALRTGSLGQGASLLGGALPGGAIVSAAVSSVGALAGGGSGAAAASYAATGRAAPASSSVGGMGKPGGAAAASYARSSQAEGAPAPLRSSNADDGRIDVLDPLQDGDYALTLVVEKATSGLKDTLKTNVRTTAPQQVRIVVGFSVEAGVLKTKHDTAKNSIGNIR